jgi:hypothetical protein
MNNYRKVLLILSIPALLIALNGCTGGSMLIKADKLEYPASLTEGIYDKNMNLVAARDYTIVNSFKFKVKRWTSCSTMIPLGGNPDLSSKLNTLIKQNEGDGIVNLHFETKENALQICSNALIVSGFIIPGTVTVEVTGDVVKFDKK